MTDMNEALQAARETLYRAHRAYRNADLPMSMGLDVTYRCDLDCDHCYLENKDSWPEMTTQEWKSVLRQAKDLGTLQLGWSGGEVFARRDFCELIAYAGQLGFLSVVKTHGGNVTPERAQILASSGVYRADVSVYSLDAALHDSITRIPGSLEGTFRGMRIMRDAGLGVRASIVVMPSNLHEMEALDGHIRAMGCYPNFSLVILPDQTGDESIDRLALDPAQLVEARMILMKLRRARGEPMLIESKKAGDPPCAAGRSHIYVTPDGAVWPCLNFPMALGHLREQTLAGIWSGSDKREALRVNTNADRDGCLSCAGNGVCGYCQGQAYTRTGDYHKAPPQFHLRTRSTMEAYQRMDVHHFSAAEWRTVPLPEIPDVPEPGAQHKKKFVFPIYRPQKGRGQRAHKVATSAGRQAGGCSS